MSLPRLRSFAIVFIFLLGITGSSAGPVPAGKPAHYPDWWFTRDVLVRLDETNPAPSWPGGYPTSDDFAVVNQGQARHLAKQAYKELKHGFQAGAGADLTAMWENPLPSSDDYIVINQGQLKALAAPFYQQLGIPFPWSGSPLPADDFAAVNLGQLKYVFSWVVSLDFPMGTQLLPESPVPPLIPSYTLPSKGTYSPVRNSHEPALDADKLPPGSPPPSLASEMVIWMTPDFEAPSYYSAQTHTNTGVAQFINAKFQQPVIDNPRWPGIDSDPDAELFSATSVPGWKPVYGDTIELHKVGEGDSGAGSSVELAADCFYTNVGENQSFPERECNKPLKPDPGSPIGTAGSGVWQEIDVTAQEYLLSFAHRGRFWSDSCANPGPTEFSATSFDVRLTVKNSDGEEESYTYGHPSSSLTVFKKARIPFRIRGLPGETFKLKVEFLNTSSAHNFGVRIDNVQLFRLKDPDSGRPYTLPLSEASGPKYRKISLTGRPLSDERPQRTSESDEEPEETYVDALTLQLRHSTTDVYLPVPASSLALSVRRNAAAESYHDANGLRFHERVDQPFGPGWSSSIAPTIRFEILNTTDLRSAPDHATVYDENGEATRYVILYASDITEPTLDAIAGFFPLPSSKNETISLYNRLERDGSDFVLTKRYGTKVRYERTDVEQEVSENRIRGSESKTVTYYARATEVKDTYGNKLNYSYEGDSSLIPARIYVTDASDTETGLEIEFGYSSGLVTEVRDSAGNVTTYNYQISTQLATPTKVLAGIVAPAGSSTTYGYQFAQEADQLSRLRGGGDDQSYHYHIALASIQDAEGRATRFGYTSQHLFHNYHTDFGHYLQSGRPLQLAWVDLPGVGGNQDVFFKDRSLMKMTFSEDASNTGDPDLTDDSKRVTEVTDAEGNMTVYTWLGFNDSGDRIGNYEVNQAVEISELYGDEFDLADDFNTPFEVLLTEMRVTYLKGTKANNALGTEKYVFSPDAQMAVKQVTDFSGNVTKYSYAEEIPDVVIGDNPLEYFDGLYHPDPNAERRYDGNDNLLSAKHFRYVQTSAGRLQSAVRDPEGRLTVYSFSGERRTHERIYASSEAPSTDSASLVAIGDPVQVTRFLYSDSGESSGSAGWPVAFMTDKIVGRHASDPDWAQALHTKYVPITQVQPNRWRVREEVVLTTGDDELKTSFAYDRNGNKRLVVDPRGFPTWFEYDGRNRIFQTTFADGNKKTIQYDGAGNRVLLTDELGRRIGHHYDAGNRLVRTIVDMSVPPNLTYVPSESDRFQGDSAAEDLITQRTYNKVRSLHQLTDARGGTVTHFYDALQRLIAKQTPAVAITDPADGATDVLRVPTQWFVYGNNSGGHAFDGSGFKPTATVDPRGYVTAVKYDGLYRPVATASQYAGTRLAVASATPSLPPLFTAPDLSSWGTRPTNFSTTWTEYDDVGNPTASTDPLGRRTETDFDALNRPTTVRFAVTNQGAVNPAYGYRRTDYTTTGLPWRVRDENGHETETHYDGAGRPVKVVLPLVNDGFGVTKRPELKTDYDANGNAVAATDPLGNVTETLYDERNRPIHTVGPLVVDMESKTQLRPIMSKVYDAAGNLTESEDARSNATRHFYDAANRVTHVFTPRVAYLEAGATTSVTRHLVTENVYDANGNVKETWQGYASTIPTTPPQAGINYVRVRKTVDNSYDAHNRLVSTTQFPTANSTNNITVENKYDAAGNRTVVVDGKTQRTGFEYDGLNRNTVITDPAERSLTYVYNALNKTARIDSRNQRTEYDYDDRHRLEHVRYIGRTLDNRDYSYDLIGRVRTVSEPNKGGVTDVAYTYDALGRQDTETSLGKTHAYRYDLANNRIKVTYGGTSTVLTSTYDALNRLATLTENGRVTTYRYDLAGNRSFHELPNKDKTITAFDALNRPTSIVTTAAASTLHTLAQAYDLTGNVARITEDYSAAVLADRTIANNYDGANRLVEESVVEGAKTTVTTYSYDKAHNRSDKIANVTESGTTTTVATNYVYNNLNQLRTATEGTKVTTFTYDLNGNRETVVRQLAGTPVGNDAYAYDFENRLMSLTVGSQFAGAPAASAGTYAYVYDYRTRRVERTENATTTKLVFSGGVSVAEYQGGTTSVSSLTAEYIRGSDWGGGVGGLLYSVRSGAPSFKHYNSRGDVISATDATGAATWQGTYEAYGTRTQEVGTTADRQKANTKEEDPTGLLNEGFRYRCLETGVFITRDPLGFVDGPNMYAYVVQNPWSKFDPEGLAAGDIMPVPQFRSNDLTKVVMYTSEVIREQWLKTVDDKTPTGREIAIEIVRDRSTGEYTHGDMLEGGNTSVGKAPLPGGESAHQIYEEMGGNHTHPGVNDPGKPVKRQDPFTTKDMNGEGDKISTIPGQSTWVVEGPTGNVFRYEQKPAPGQKSTPSEAEVDAYLSNPRRGIDGKVTFVGSIGEPSKPSAEKAKKEETHEKPKNASNAAN